MQSERSDDLSAAIPKPTLLEQVATYYLDPKNLPSKRSEIWKQSLMAFVALSGAPLYAIPADNYSIRTYGESNIGMRVNCIFGTCVPALLVLYNSTDLFLTLRALQKPPEALKDVLKTSSARQRFYEELGIYMGAALSAVPLTMISLAYPIPGIPHWVAYLMALIVEIDNTVLHFLPIQLALQNSYYCFLLIPFVYMYRHFIKKKPTCDEENKIAIEVENALIYKKIKDILYELLSLVKNNIALNGFVFNKKKLAYDLRLPQELVEVVTSENEGIWKLNAIMRYRQKATEATPKLYERPLKSFLYTAGAFWVISSCSGYLAGTVTQMSVLTDSYVGGGLLSAASIYFLTVLFAFYGGNYLQDVFDYLTSWKENDIKIPIEFKMYPKFSTLLVAFAVYVTCFSYAAAEELIENNFDKDTWGGMYDALVWLALTGVPFISFTAMLAFYVRSINKFAVHFGGEEEKLVATLCNMIDGLQSSIFLMPNEELKNSVDNLEEGDLSNLFDMDASEYREHMSKLRSDDSVSDAEVSSRDKKVSPKSGYAALSEVSVSRGGFFSSGSGGDPDSSPESSPPVPNSRTLAVDDKPLAALEGQDFTVSMSHSLH